MTDEILMFKQDIAAYSLENLESLAEVLHHRACLMMYDPLLIEKMEIVDGKIAKIKAKGQVNGETK